MRRLKIILVFLLLVLLIFVGYVLVSTGFFRTIENTFAGKTVTKITAAGAGAEDMMLVPEMGVAIVSSSPRAKELEMQQEIGGLYLVDLKSEAYQTRKLTADFNKPFAPHGISSFKTDSTYTVMTINHTVAGHFFEIFKLQDSVLVHQKTMTDSALVSPNDVVMLDENRFYFTNDHRYEYGFGRFLEDYAGVRLSNVVYFDGEKYSEVANGIAYANGINYDAKRNLLFVASPRNFLVKVYQPNDDGSLNFIEDIDCGTGVDNIEFDDEGNLWIGAHPNLLAFSSYAAGRLEKAPSEVIKIDYRSKGNYSIEQIYMNDGSEISASTVAVPYQDIILIGSVMDGHFLVLKPDKK